MANKRPEPKPASARQGYTPKAGPYSGGKRASRGKRQQPETLVEGLRHDRTAASQTTRQPTTTPPQPFKVRFYDRLGSCLLRKAKNLNWSMSTRQNVIRYARSLVHGDGSVPEGLTGKVLETVRWHFAMTCLVMDANAGRFPGQSMDWFEEKLEEVKAFRAGQQARMAA